MHIDVSETAMETGLAVMLRDLISQNMDQHPHKLIDFRKLNLSIGLEVIDVDIALTLEFAHNTLTIHSGILDRPPLYIATDSQTVMALSNQKIKWGLPWYFDETGREIRTAMKQKRLRVQGMVAHFPSLVRFSRVMSVHP